MKRRARFKDFESEESWLNSLGDEGYILRKRGSFGSYIFDKTDISEPEYKVDIKNFNYKIDFRMFSKKSKFLEYVQFFDDCGWVHVCGTASSGRQYFISKDENVNDDIFSDTYSKSSRYLRLRNNWVTVLFTYVCFLIVFGMNGLIDVGAIVNPKVLYYTPGLWEMQGSLFWKAFLFETPFAIGRGFYFLVFPVMIVISLYYIIRLSLENKKNKFEMS